MEIALLLLQSLQNLLRQLDTSLAALCPDLGQCKLAASVLTELLYIFKLRRGVRKEGIQCHHNRHTIQVKILDMLLQIDDSLLQCSKVLRIQLILGHTTIILQSTNCGNQHHRIGL